MTPTPTNPLCPVTVPSASLRLKSPSSLGRLGHLEDRLQLPIGFCWQLPPHQAGSGSNNFLFASPGRQWKLPHVKHVHRQRQHHRPLITNKRGFTVFWTDLTINTSICLSAYPTRQMLAFSRVATTSRSTYVLTAARRPLPIPTRQPHANIYIV